MKPGDDEPDDEPPVGAELEPAGPKDVAVGGGVERMGPHGAPLRYFRVGLSVDALALAWARQETGPALAAVLVDQEVSPRGHHGRLWTVPPGGTLTLGIILRPALRAEEADVVWLAAGLVAVTGAVAAGAAPAALATWWPDSVVDTATGAEVAMVKVETQLGPGQVRSAVLIFRFDLERLGLGGRADALLAAVLDAAVQVASDLDDDAGGVAGMYTARCALAGERVKAKLLPKGESRGVARTLDREGRLQLESATGMVERMSVHQLRSLEVVP